MSEGERGGGHGRVTPKYPYSTKCSLCENIFEKITTRHIRCPNCSDECRYGTNCTRTDCYFNHPSRQQLHTDDNEVNDTNDTANTHPEVTPKLKRSRDSSYESSGSSGSSGYTTTSGISTSTHSTNSNRSDAFLPEDSPAPPSKRTRSSTYITCRDEYTTPSSIHVVQMPYTSKEQLSVNIIFADKREGNQRVFGDENQRAPYEYALETALDRNDDFNKAARECKEIFVENMIHRNGDNRMYFSGHMRKFDHYKENRIKCYTFHLFVTEPRKQKDFEWQKEFEYLNAEVVEAAEYITIMKQQDIIDEQNKEIKFLRDEIEHLRDGILSN